MTAGKRIAFIHYKSFSGANIRFLEALEKAFPGYAIDAFDVGNYVRRIDLIGILATLRYYGLKPLLNQKNPWDFYIKTPYMFRKIQRLLRRDASGLDYACSVQTQSLFDGSLDKVPHLVYTDHTHLENLNYPGFDPTDLACKTWQELEKTIYPKAATVFTMSSNISESLNTVYGLDSHKVVKIGCGANVSVSEDYLPDNEKYSSREILFVGKDWERKGGPDLIEAFIQVRQAIPDAKLTVIGCSPNVTLPGCRILGQIPPESVSTHYQQAALFCMPSHREPFGFVFLEAMAFALPLVGSNIGATADYIHQDKNGYRIDPGNPAALAKTLTAILDKPEKLRDLGATGQKHYWKDFGWDRAAQGIRNRVQQALPDPVIS